MELTVRHVHENKIRKYHPRALAVGVIFEGDHEFGEIHPTPNVSRSTSERVLYEINLNHHLKETSLKIKVDEQIEELLRLDLIEESDAEIAYPIVCVNKKDGTLRLCVDFRALNSESVSDDFPMEDAVELIHSIGGANIITTLDLLKGYWAIPMAEDSKILHFSRLIGNSTVSRTSFHLDTILTKLSELNFTVNLKKCAFGKTQIKYLGHIIGSGKHEPDPENTAVINNLLVPKRKKELRSVLGLCNYYREYIPKYSELVYPLTELTKKRVPDSIPWTEKHDSSFHLLKKALVEAPSLNCPVPDKPYTIHSDASQIGIAACLSQKCGDKCYPIAYASQKLSKTQQSWSTIKPEAFAIVWSLKKFEVWVFGTEIEFYIDHNPLPYLTKSAPQSARLQRCTFALQKFNVTIKHCPGVKMPHADALSRLV
ncbi:retrovirus-related Pol polyprotein from transposon opus [Trichonephila clavipes]|nr:retrovirus-related Pol polyprotein from transposon opus [Trichonephila clavipes]